MNNIGNSMGKKRKANEMLKEHEELENKARESYLASNESMQKRRIVRVVREDGVKGSETNETKTEEERHGKFQFLSKEKNVANVTTESEKKPAEVVNSDTKTKSKVPESESKKDEEAVKDSTGSKKMNFGDNPWSNETFKPRFSNNSNNLINLNNKPPADLNRNPFLSGVSNSNTITTNPFLKNQTNLKSFSNISSTNKTASSFLQTKSTFNFNLNQGQTNPNWNSEEEEEEGEEINPETEIQIEAKNMNRPEVVIPKTTNPKVTKISLEDLSVYDFGGKKYNSKGKGDLSIELVKTENENNASIIAFLIYRNTALSTLFKANIVKQSTCEKVSRNFKNFAVLNKLVYKSEVNDKSEIKSVKLRFSNEQTMEDLVKKFNFTKDIIEKNDLTLLEDKGDKQEATEPNGEK